MAEQSIALIGAGSALAGVLVTGVFALLQGRQNRLDKQMDRDEQRRLLHRQARKDAYAALLVAYHEVERSLEAVSKSRSIAPGAAVPPLFYTAESAVVALWEAGSAVSLEGPSEAAAAVKRLHDASVKYLGALAELAMEAEADDSDSPLWARESPARSATKAEFKQAYRSFVETARVVLGGNDPGLR